VDPLGPSRVFGCKMTKGSPRGSGIERSGRRRVHKHSFPKLTGERGRGDRGEPAALEVATTAWVTDLEKGRVSRLPVCHSGGLAVCGLGVLPNPDSGSKAIAQFISASRMNIV